MLSPFYLRAEKVKPGFLKCLHSQTGMRSSLILFLFIFSLSSHALNLDSLYRVMNNSRLPDTSRFDAIDALRDYYREQNPDSFSLYVEKLLSFAGRPGLNMGYALYQKGYLLVSQNKYKEAIAAFDASLKACMLKKDKLGEARALYNKGLACLRMGNHEQASRSYSSAAALYKLTKDTLQQAQALNQVALANDYMGNLPDALDNYFKSLELLEAIKHKFGQSVVLLNIAEVLSQMGDNEQAIQRLKKAEILKKEVNDETGLAIIQSTIAGIYGEQHKNEQALEMFKQALIVFRKTGGVKYEVATLTSIAGQYRTLYRDKEAEEYYRLAIELAEKNEMNNELSSSLSGLGKMKAEQAKFREAETACLRGLALSRAAQNLKNRQNNCHCLAKAYEEMGDTRKALMYFKEYSSLKDSLSDEKHVQDVIKRIMEHDIIKQHRTDSLNTIRTKEISDLKFREQESQIKKERTQRYALYGVILLFLVLGGVVYRAYRQKRLDNLIITRQKEQVLRQKTLVDEKNKEILDSITYAKRIQEAILPPEGMMKEALTQSFVFYKPKDIVAGDFYWLEPGQNKDQWLVAVADCTGHGVPGALVSVVCYNALNRAVREFNLLEPGPILDKTRELVVEQFEKSTGNVMDGMDIALCSFNTGTGILKYAGANNPLWIIRNGQGTVEEIKATKQPIGKTDVPQLFITHTLNLRKGDTFYIFSDGFPDQFGGKDGKKLKSSGFRQVLLQAANKSPGQQREWISEYLQNWIGTLEQIDDICLIGVRYS